MKQIKWLINIGIWGLLVAGLPLTFTSMALAAARGGRWAMPTAFARSAGKGGGPLAAGAGSGGAVGATSGAFAPENGLGAAWSRSFFPNDSLRWNDSLATSPSRMLAGRRAETTVRMQHTPLSLPPSRYKLTDGSDTLLLPAQSGAGCLRAFFDGLDSLAAGKDTVLTVVHLGDSHIQAGHYSGQTMRLMQQQFGNAGRGWIAPFKLSRTNEPDDYFISSVVKDWVAGRCIQAAPKTPLGPGGIGLKTQSPAVNLDVSIAPVNGAGYAFNQAVLYRGDRSMPLLPAGPLKGSVHTFRAGSLCAPGLLADTFRIDRLTDTLQLHSTRRKQGTDQLLPASSFTNVYYGLSLTNSRPGILYHAVGVNGAMFVNYTDETYIRRLAALRPSLLIVSLGTNETFGRRFNADEFARQAADFLRLVRRYMPDVCLLLTTPAECYKRVYVNKKRVYQRNENTARAARALVGVARKEGIACWDLFTATGGANSCRKWQKAGLMGRDRIHFSKEGYQEQGTLLFRALMQAYAASAGSAPSNQPHSKQEGRNR